jgi:hypothetical protein
MVTILLLLDIIINYEKETRINYTKLDNQNEDLRRILDKRYSTAGKSFGLSAKKNFHKFINDINKKEEGKPKQLIASELQDKVSSRFNFDDFLTPLKSDRKSKIDDTVNNKNFSNKYSN